MGLGFLIFGMLKMNQYKVKGGCRFCANALHIMLTSMVFLTVSIVIYEDLNHLTLETNAYVFVLFSAYNF